MSFNLAICLGTLDTGLYLLLDLTQILDPALKTCSCQEGKTMTELDISNIDCLEMMVPLKRGGNADEDIADAYSNPAWKVIGPMMPSLIAENFVLAMVQSNHRGRVPNSIGIPARLVLNKATQQARRARRTRWETSPLNLLNKLEHWMEGCEVFYKWASELDLKYSLYNVAELMGDEIAWRRSSGVMSTKSEAYRTWRKKRFVNKVFVFWGLVASLIWNRPNEDGPLLPPNVNKVLDWLEFNIDREYRFYGMFDQVFRDSLSNLMASLGSWLSESPDFNAWATVMDADQILMSCTRWLDAELRNYEDSLAVSLEQI